MLGLPHGHNPCKQHQAYQQQRRNHVVCRQAQQPEPAEEVFAQQHQRHEAHYRNQPVGDPPQQRSACCLPESSTGSGGRKQPESVPADPPVFPGARSASSSVSTAGNSRNVDSSRIRIASNPPARRCTGCPGKGKMISRLGDRQAQCAQQHHQRHGNAHPRQGHGQICRKWWKEPTGKDDQRNQRRPPPGKPVARPQASQQSRIRLSGRQGCSALEHGSGGGGAFDWSDLIPERPVLWVTNHVHLKPKFGLQSCGTQGFMLAIGSAGRYSAPPMAYLSRCYTLPWPNSI